MSSCGCCAASPSRRIRPTAGRAARPARPDSSRALARSPKHFAAHHYLTHALENAGRVSDALPHAAAYRDEREPHSACAAHARSRAAAGGRIDEAITAFEQADRLETSYLETENVPAELEWHYEHNLDLLASSYRYLGQAARAERTLKTAFDLPSALIVQMFNKRSWPEFLVSRGPDRATPPTRPAS